MLKIKDNVDLKELEKFGFCKYESNYGFSYYAFDDLLINEESRIISLFKIKEEELIRFFDLCQAGLVEKVVDNE